MFITTFMEIAATVTGAAQATRDQLIEVGCGDVIRFCPIVPGDIAWDECECGMFAQTITAIFPSNIFPNPATDQRQNACGPHMRVVNVTANLVRCAPNSGDNGASPTCDALEDAAIQLECDRYVLRQAITCYLRNLRLTNRIIEFAVGTATTIGPQGSCVGVELSYQFAIPGICCT